MVADAQAAAEGGPGELQLRRQCRADEHVPVARHAHGRVDDEKGAEHDSDPHCEVEKAGGDTYCSRRARLCHGSTPIDDRYYRSTITTIVDKVEPYVFAWAERCGVVAGHAAHGGSLVVAVALTTAGFAAARVAEDLTIAQAHALARQYAPDMLLRRSSRRDQAASRTSKA